MTATKQSGCRFCGTKLEHTFVDLGMSPLCESFLPGEQLNQMEAFYPLHAYVCGKCFLVQLEAYVTPEHIFSDYAYFSSYSDSWLAHAKKYTDRMVERFGIGGKSFVVELASNDGYLLLGNNVLAQVPDLNDFVAGMKILLKPSGVITMEFPHLQRLMEENQFDTIYHEHFSYFSFVTVEKIFAAHGITLFDVEELPTHGGSLRIYGRHAEDSSKPVTAQVTELRRREEAAGTTRLETYSRFAEQVKETKRKLLEFLIAAKRNGKKIAGYGAPGKGNTLLNYCAIRTDFLDYTVDRNPYKHGRFLPGTHVPIFPPDRIRETKPDFLLILPWNLKDEIIKQNAFIREWGGKFVVPIPEVQVHE